MEPRGFEPLSESNLERVSPGAVCYLHSLIPAGTNTLRELVASLFMVRAKLSAHTVSTQITPEPGSWTFRGGWAPNQAAIATELLSVKFKKLPVLSWPGATARYSSLTTPVETSTAPEIVCHCETVRTLSWQSPPNVRAPSKGRSSSLPLRGRWHGAAVTDEGKGSPC